MTPRRNPVAMVAVALVLVLTSPWLGALEKQNADNGLLVPIITPGQGEKCVADTQFMRRNHMTMLKHQRDETVREGIRGNPYSIGECINCHVVIGADAQPVSIASEKHFCRACHDYAAVKIDCFECHASRPERDSE